MAKSRAGRAAPTVRARKILDVIEVDNLCRLHIRDRVLELHLCTKLITLFEGTDQHAKGALEISGIRHEIGPALPLLHCCVDTAIVMCRSLLNFLGVKLAKPEALHPLGLFDKKEPKEPTDLWIENIDGLTAITLSTAVAACSRESEARTLEALARTLRMANKGIAHMTEEPARSIGTLEAVKLSCEVVAEMVNRYLYEALGKPPISGL
jgi:hypothetical protein